MKCIKKITLLLVCLWSASVWAGPNALYFMDILPYQSYQNPAFRPLSNAYVELPALSTISVSTGFGGLSLNDIMYVQDGQLVTFLHPEYGNKDALFAKLNPANRIDFNTDISLLGFGFNVKGKGYFTFNTSVRADMALTFPKDLVSLALYGTPNIDGVNRYDLGAMAANVRTYVDVSGGYSHRINDKWSVGGRLHVLWGLAAAQLKFDELYMEASQDVWHLRGQGRAQISFPGIQFQTDQDGNISGFDIAEAKDILAAYKPSLGAAIDLGVEYRPIPELRLSLSVKDIGFMYWNNLLVADAKVAGSYEGVYYEPGTETNIADSLLATITGSFVPGYAGKGYFQETMGKLYVGAEYSFLRNMMSVGVLSRTEFMSNYILEEISLNYKIRPCHWFGISAGYSFFSGGWNTIGFAMDLKLPPFNFYVATDYTPLFYSAQGIPYKSQGFNLQTGIVLTFKTKDNTKRLTARTQELAEMPVDSTKVLNDSLFVDSIAVTDSLVVLDSILVTEPVEVPEMPMDSTAVTEPVEVPEIPADSVQSIQDQWEALVDEAGVDSTMSVTTVVESTMQEVIDAKVGEDLGTEVVKMTDGKKEE